MTGHTMTPEEVLQEVEKDRAYYVTSGGGVTFSGGEPVLQADYLRETLRLCKARGLSTAVETAGNVPWESLRLILPYTDLFLYDLKLIDPKAHARWTGTDNARILENLERLCRAGARVCIRIPAIPGVNLTEENMRAAAEFIKGLCAYEQVELIPFHTMAAGKYESLGLLYAVREFRVPESGELEGWLRYLCARGIRACVS